MRAKQIEEREKLEAKLEAEAREKEKELQAKLDKQREQV